jgi:hypothetical protein
MRLRLVSGLLAVALAAGTAAAQLPATRVWVTLPGFPAPIALDTIMTPTEIDAPAGKLWAASERVFYDLKIATDTRDSVKGVVGVVRFAKSNYIGDMRMSQALNCGMGLTGPNADNFRINMAIMAIVTPISATRSRYGLAFIGSALDMRGNSSDPVTCSTTGRFEQDFIARMKRFAQMP